jgi:hypothetical protein
VIYQAPQSAFLSSPSPLGGPLQIFFSSFFPHHFEHPKIMYSNMPTATVRITAVSNAPMIQDDHTDNSNASVRDSNNGESNKSQDSTKAISGGGNGL